MKQCPECHEQFSDEEQFCDQDGAVLMEQKDQLADSGVETPRQSSSALITGVIGGFVGVLICVLLYAVFLMPAQNSDGTQSKASSTREVGPGRSSQLAAAPVHTNTPPVEDASPSPEAQPSPSAAPTAAPAATAPPAPLNNGPIATGSKEARNTQQRAMIVLKDGSSLEADAAWEDSQGFWYRRGSMVSFVDRSRVDKITSVAEEKPAAETGKH